MKPLHTKCQHSRAIVLRHVDFRESDRVITVFTLEQGRMAGLAKGVRKSVRRFAGRLDLFSLVVLEHRDGRGELSHFERADLLSAHLGIRSELYRIAWASFLCELVERLYGEGEPHPEAFEVLEATLSYLDTAARVGEGPLRAAELRLLCEAGLQPELEACAICRVGVESGRAFAFVVARGGLVCEHCQPSEQDEQVPAETIALLSAALFCPLEGLWRLPFGLREARGARSLLTSFVRHHVGERLRTASFLQELEVQG
ncbi:MAG: DNA repair protein RecO [Myxococcota bacterium]